MIGITRRATLGALVSAPLNIERGPRFFEAAADPASLAVDVALVLATDTSPSVNSSRWFIQKGGYAAAFRNPRIIEVMTSGETGRVAATFVEWANPNLQSQAVGWSLLDGPDAAENFAGQIEAAVRMPYAKNTSISGGILFSDRLLMTMPYQAGRKVIDVSGDGVENSPIFSPAAVQVARQIAVGHGATINGLAIVTSEHADLEQYYRDNVVGGLGSFVIAADQWADFPNAILRKLMLETASMSNLRNRELA